MIGRSSKSWPETLTGESRAYLTRRTKLDGWGVGVEGFRILRVEVWGLGFKHWVYLSEEEVARAYGRALIEELARNPHR